MARETFILLHTKTFRHFLKLYIKVGDKTDQRTCEFTTAHKVSEKERNRNARKVAAEYSTSDEAVINALYHDSGYGKVFTHKDDPKGEKGQKPFKLTPSDKKKVALENLFKIVNLEFDPNKDVAVLEQEYQIFMNATKGISIQPSTANSIPHTPVDVQGNIADAVAKAVSSYEEKYNRDWPEFGNRSDELNFIDSLQNPEFNPEEYLKEKGLVVEENEGDGLPETAVELQAVYRAVIGNNPPQAKKNDVAWMTERIKSKQGVTE